MMLWSHHICISTNYCLRYNFFCDSADNSLIRSTVCTEINITQTYLHQQTFDNNKVHSACNYIARRLMYFTVDRGKACNIRTGWKGEIKAACVIVVRSILNSVWWRHIKQSSSVVTSNNVNAFLIWKLSCVNQMLERQSHDDNASGSNGSDKRQRWYYCEITVHPRRL